MLDILPFPFEGRPFYILLLPLGAGGMAIRDRGGGSSQVCLALSGSSQDPLRGREIQPRRLEL